MQSLDYILGRLRSQILTPEQQQFQDLCECWLEIVGTVAGLHSRPVSWHRGVLNVATSSSTWSQDLTLRRVQIIQKLNQKLLFTVQDIRFSAAGWLYQSSADQQISLSASTDELSQIWHEHPSRVEVSTPTGKDSIEVPLSSSSDALTAFESWANNLKVRSQHLPLCPQCHCPTPAGELSRWSVCGFCAMQNG
jgi:predicted nucleic acid-binding Zn ribbon protein